MKCAVCENRMNSSVNVKEDIEYYSCKITFSVPRIANQDDGDFLRAKFIQATKIEVEKALKSFAKNLEEEEKENE